MDAAEKVVGTCVEITGEKVKMGNSKICKCTNGGKGRSISLNSGHLEGISENAGTDVPAPQDWGSSKWL